MTESASHQVNRRTYGESGTPAMAGYQEAPPWDSRSPSCVRGDCRCRPDTGGCNTTLRSNWLRSARTYARRSLRPGARRMR